MANRSATWPFVTTWMDDEAEQLAWESLNKNLINTAEYPQTEAMHQRVIHMIARLFHAHVSSPPDTEPTSACQPGFIGTTTVGSSEAVMLALLAHKWNWKKQHQHNPHRSAKDRPYLLIGTHTHACFAKVCTLFRGRGEVDLPRTRPLCHYRRTGTSHSGKEDRG